MLKQINSAAFTYSKLSILSNKKKKKTKLYYYNIIGGSYDSIATMKDLQVDITMAKLKDFCYNSTI